MPLSQGEGGRGGTAFQPIALLDRFDERLDSCRGADAVAFIVLDEAVAFHHAQFGNLQLLDASGENLIIAAQRGFGPAFLSEFATVSAEDNTACGRALRSRQPVVIPDINDDVLYEPYRDIAAEAGYRSVQSTPMIASDGHRVGVLSTHFARPHRPSEVQLTMTRLYSQAAANSLRELAGHDPAQARSASIANIDAYLALSETHIAEAAERIERQLDVIDRLRERDLPLHTAEGLLRVMLDSLSLMLWHRRIVKRRPTGA